MSHDWKNDWIKPEVRVEFDRQGERVKATVRLLSHDAQLVLVQTDAGEEVTLPRGDLQPEPPAE